MAAIALVNPRFDESYWVLDTAVDPALGINVTLAGFRGRLPPDPLRLWLFAPGGGIE